MTSAPFLRRVVVTPPNSSGVGADLVVPSVGSPEAEQPIEGLSDELTSSDFPDWYQDQVAVEEAETDESEVEDPSGSYVFELAAVKMFDQLKFGAVTILVGDNGTGKSTVVEAIATAAGFNPEGGSRNLNFRTHDTHSRLNEHLTLEWSKMPNWGWFLRAETFYGMASHITADDDPYGGVAHIFPDLHNKSHGESFLDLARSRFMGEGLYFFDEPESALSIQGQMALAGIMASSLAAGSQFIIATHSPVFMAFPGASIYEFDAESGFERCEFDDLLTTSLWQRFFADPASFYGRYING